MVALSMSSLVFGLAVNGKFQESMNKTFSSRNYTYAIDLTSPTSQGGQYYPVSSSEIGRTGAVTTQEGTNFVPNMYTDSTFTNSPPATSSQDTSYDDAFKPGDIRSTV
jgi:hypothetical protein